MGVKGRAASKQTVEWGEVRILLSPSKEGPIFPTSRTPGPCSQCGWTLSLEALDPLLPPASSRTEHVHPQVSADAVLIWLMAPSVCTGPGLPVQRVPRAGCGGR